MIAIGVYQTDGRHKPDFVRRAVRMAIVDFTRRLRPAGIANRGVYVAEYLAPARDRLTHHIHAGKVAHPSSANELGWYSRGRTH